MANTWDAVGKNFNFDTTTTTAVADMTALRGGAPDVTTDRLYVAESASATLESNVGLLETYVGDNSAGTAAVKTGHIIVAAGVTLTYGTNTANKGNSGEGSTSTFTTSGTAVSGCTITDANVDKWGNYDIRGCVQTYNYTTFEHSIAPVRSSGANNITCNYCTFDDGTYMFYVSNTEYPPASATGCVGQGNQYMWYDGGTTTTYDALAYLKTNEVRSIGNADGTNAILIKMGTTSGINRFASIRFNAASIIAAPSWTTTTGIQTLVDNLDGTLTATFGAATHGTSDQTNYRIYIRAGSAPDSFGKGSTYFLGETADTTFTIATDATGARLANATAYYVIVKAATDSSAEDANTTSLNVTTATVTLANIFSILQVVMVNTLG